MDNYYLGGDVSKGYCDFVIIDSEKKIVEKNFQLDDTHAGHTELKRILSNLLYNKNDSLIYAGVESTGGYENNWYKMLYDLKEELNVSTARLNPFGIYHSSQADLKKNKTDKSSALNVAEYLISYPAKVEYNREHYYESLRRMWKHILILKKHKVGLMGQLESLVYVANPDIMAYWKEKMPDWVLSVLSKYPTSKDIAKVKAATLSKIPYLTKEKAELLIKAAKKTVASLVDDSIAFLIKSLANEILASKKNIDAQMSYLKEECDIPEVELLMSFCGIGLYSAVGLMLLIGKIDRFSSAKTLASFFGVHPIYKESGDGIGGIRMSKQGRAEARWLLFMVAKAAIVHNTYIKKLYFEYQEKGKSKMSSLGIIMHKITRIIYGMLKSSNKYDSQIDQKNREDNKRKKPLRAAKNIKRRFQSIDEKAPISRRQTSKRKEQESSQNGVTIKHGIEHPAQNNYSTEKKELPIY